MKKLFYLLAFSVLALACNREFETEIQTDTIYVRERQVPFYEMFLLPTTDSVLVLDVANKQVFYRTIENGIESDVKIMFETDFLVGLYKNNQN